MSTKHNILDLQRSYKKSKISHEFSNTSLLKNKSLSEILYEMYNKIQLLEFKINQIDHILNSIINPIPLNNHQPTYII